MKDCTTSFLPSPRDGRGWVERHDEETAMMRHPRRRNVTQLASRAAAATGAIVVLLSLASPVGASTSSSVALRIARYALGTATHDRPAHVVTAADVSNAAGISTVNPKELDPLINLGDVYR